MKRVIHAIIMKGDPAGRLFTLLLNSGVGPDKTSSLRASDVAAMNLQTPKPCFSGLCFPGRRSL